MEYIDVDNTNILNDLIKRKEFYTLKNIRKYERKSNVEPNLVLDKMLKYNKLVYYSYQKFVQNFINPDTPYKRLLMKHSTGSGKTIGAIGVAMEFIKYFKKAKRLGVPDKSIGSVFIIGFDGAKKAFQKDLLRFTEFGFTTRSELDRWNELKTQALSNNEVDINNAHAYGSRIKRRIENRTGNGFFKFMGYKTLVNRLLISDKPISNMTEDDIMKSIKSGDIKINQDIINSFKDSLIICDEIHNTYNSLQKNNWGVAIQLILDTNPNVRALFMSATPINNDPSEIVDLLNLLVPPNKRIVKNDIFNNKKLKNDGLHIIRKLCTGRISYLINKSSDAFPSQSFGGTKIQGLEFLKFIRCPFNKHHEIEYNKIYNKKIKTISQDSRNINDIILPSPDGKNEYIYKSTDIKKIVMADQKWKNDNNINVINNVITGEILKMQSLKNLSNKYYTMLHNLIKNIKERKGKNMIYHNYVSNSGTLLIKEILLRNGILDEFMTPVNNTLCSKCGFTLNEHKDLTRDDSDSYTVYTKPTDHIFQPLRCILITSDIDKQSIEKSITKYNHPSNNMGDSYNILIGSRVIKESYDLHAIKNLMIMGRPDNISTLIQIIGRAVRKNSHITLPNSMRHVLVSIYTHMLSSNKLSYEELKYKEKIEDYKVIQSIEKILHENAIDSVVNFNINNNNNNDSLYNLKFTPSIMKNNKHTFKLSELNMDTFNIYKKQQEVDLVTYIIKRAFIETSNIWKWEDLLIFVKNPNFNVEYDTTLIDISTVILALSSLIWENEHTQINPYITDNDKKISIIDKIYNTNNKHLILPNGQISVLTQVGEYYTLVPLINNKISNEINYQHIIDTTNNNTNINILEYLSYNSNTFNYEKKLVDFEKKYKNTPIENLNDAVCDYGIDFHIKFLEDCISYIFNHWTNWSVKKSKYHSFYFKMLYYYDIIGLVVFANTAKAMIYDLYDEYLLPIDVNKKDKILKKAESINYDTSIDRNKRSIINLIARNISKSSCDWCPSITKKIYKKTLDTSLERFKELKKSNTRKTEKIIKVKPDNLPIGHFLQDVPRFYHPNRGWFSSPEYLEVKEKWIENPIIIGYTEKSKTGIHIRFKLRKPIQDIKLYKDSRLIEKGSMCSTRSKPFLFNLCQKLKIRIGENTSIHRICNEIKSRLMYLELLERSRGTRLKFFYNYFEL